ncbi:sigma-70 family RNA polymerase sigma factor [Tissierella sp.]|uniref:sigma-70 family RNA polymerase sigma factor n=1 Tax=Tissierella sp. TaxID=41274 RepID=UPI0028650284|nr:sigma-70 family RNA polymerase sigma factor [Tissierella sp.]MDR7856042.1 sigma-70 family RNA polymerase sigma factor [Tissierella sp.]
MEGVDRDTFIKQNMGLVGMVVNKHANRIAEHPSIDREDLKSIGTIGLIKAYDKFDPSYEVQFSTYAFHMIQGEIRRFLRDNLDTVKFTRQSKIDYYAISEAKLLNDNPETIAEILEMPIQRVNNALEYYRCKGMDSLDREIVDDEGSSTTMADKLGMEVDYDSNLEIEMFLSQLDNMEGLNKRTRKIVELRLQEKTQVEIGQELGITQVQVSRILVALQEKLKGGNEVTEKKEMVRAKDAIEMVKKLAIETVLTPAQIQEQTGVSYPTAKKYIDEHRKIDLSKTPNYILAKKLSEETELKANQISKQTGVSYTTARNYIEYYRAAKGEKIIETSVEKVSPVENVTPDPVIKNRLDVPVEVINKPEIKQADGFMTMTFKLTVENATSQLENILNAMKVLGFKDFNLTIQSQQVA